MNEEITGGVGLRAAVECLYATFARYALRPHIEGCDHCISAADHERIQSKPLRELRADDLRRYAFKALTTWGGVDDFKHFLPRILELMDPELDELEWWIDPEVAIGKLRCAGWRNWSESEQFAIEDYFKALWSTVLTAYESGSDWEADRYLCAIAQATDDLGPYLDYWRRQQAAPAVRHLAGFVSYHANAVRRRRSLGPFWKRRPVQMAQVVDWLRDPLTREALEQAFFRYADEPFAEDLSLAVDLFDWIGNPGK